jgi:hypothetical protein
MSQLVNKSACPGCATSINADGNLGALRLGYECATAFYGS